jgi:KDO2-lipid IV(A) lauroyltransferase
MCDMFLEMIKSISISEEQLKARFTFTNLEEVLRVRQTGKSCILMCGHYASYEWSNAMQLYEIGYKGMGIYKKVKNPYFDKLIKDIRARYDAELITTREATKVISSYEEQGIRAMYAMVADQSPRLERANYWTEFLGHRVPVFMGSEKLARNLDMAVMYLQVKKIKRGYYRATLIPITTSPKQEPEFKITNTYLNLLEEQIQERPELYLWTHKRWKHRNAPIPQDATVINRS